MKRQQVAMLKEQMRLRQVNISDIFIIIVLNKLTTVIDNALIDCNPVLDFDFRIFKLTGKG
jgi:hypothetical protein